MKTTLIVLAGAVVLASCGGTPSLETKTFELQSIPSNEAAAIIEPYVYADRPGAPGMIGTGEGVLTVRETVDNLAKIERVLQEIDPARGSVMLYFQVIEANGEAEPDSAIAEVVEELEKLFRFEGYRLMAQGRMGVRQYSNVQQTMYGPATGDRWFGQVSVGVNVGGMKGTGDSTTIDLDVYVNTVGVQPVMQSGLSLNVGHTVVLGATQLPGGRAMIVTVRADVGEG